MGIGVCCSAKVASEQEHNGKHSEVTPIRRSISCRINDSFGAIFAKTIHGAIGRSYGDTTVMSDVARGLIEI
ncbi:hypothetical protein ACIA5D_04950 [Actinoplanes sp. NPDC051513]|uniref:hypothetical protein n=1 Tax=Actinoplanes sp. NPDC051513 TaxID=3363908 RepID=UPI0037885B07